MDQALIAVIFLINGEVTMHPGFMPLTVESVEFCEETTKPYATEYIGGLKNVPEHVIFCTTDANFETDLNEAKAELLGSKV